MRLTAKRKQQLLESGDGGEHERLKELYRRQSSGGYLADIVFGANDGIVTTFTLVAGVVGAGLQPVVIIILGVVNILGDGLSMGFGNYLGIRSKQLYDLGQRHREEWEVDNLPSGEREEVRKIFEAWGFSGTALDEAVAIVTADRTRWVDFMMLNELHIPPLENDTPAKHGLVTFCAFVAAGVIPLMPYLLPVPYPAGFAVLASAATLFAIGALRAYVIPIHWFRAGAEMLLIGSTAGVSGYLIGLALKGLAGVA